MKVFSKANLLQEMIDHPYASNPGLLARVNFFYFSKDRKLAVAYYESPPGWFDVEVEGFEEIDYVLEGEVVLESEDNNLVAAAGDCFLIQDGDRFRWKMTKPSKMIFFIYPVTRSIEELIASFYHDRDGGMRGEQ
jgi:ethanolamine utilization protein EutQ (cupin superfamily)